jgi:hypothetical protein
MFLFSPDVVRQTPHQHGYFPSYSIGNIFPCFYRDFTVNLLMAAKSQQAGLPIQSLIVGAEKPFPLLELLLQHSVQECGEWSKGGDTSWILINITTLLSKRMGPCIQPVRSACSEPSRRIPSCLCSELENGPHPPGICRPLTKTPRPLPQMMVLVIRSNLGAGTGLLLYLIHFSCYYNSSSGLVSITSA